MADLIHRVLITFEEKDIDAVKAWLQRYGKINDCPYSCIDAPEPNCSLCDTLFPKSLKDDRCPCMIHSVKYVTKRARELIRRHERS